MHLCIVNLVIGTLYCSKGNMEFGARLVIRALDPVQETLGTDTWLYAKRCLLNLIEKLITTQVPLNSDLKEEILTFLDQVSVVGRSITSGVNQQAESERVLQTVG